MHIIVAICCRVWLSPNMVLSIMANDLLFGFVRLMDIVPDFLWFA